MSLSAPRLTAAADADGAGRVWLEAAEIATNEKDAERLFAALDGYVYLLRVAPHPGFELLVDRLLGLLPSEESPIHAQALALRAVGARSGDSEHEVDRALLTTKAVAIARRTGDLPTLVKALEALSLVDSSEPDAMAALVRAQELYRLRDDGEQLDHEWEAISRVAWALIRVGRRAEADRYFAKVGGDAPKTLPTVAMHNRLLSQAAIAIAEGRFVDGKGLAADTRRQGGWTNVAVALGYAAQITAARLEQGRVDEVSAGLAEMNLERAGITPWRAMLAGAYAQSGDHRAASEELDALMDADFAGPPRNWRASSRTISARSVSSAG